MHKVQPVLWCFLALALLFFVASEASANTSVHGYSIPTIEGARTPAIGVCGPLSSPALEGGIQGRLNDRRMSGTDSRSYHAAICFPVTQGGGPRGFVVPLAVVEAIEQVKHNLVAHFNHDSSVFDDPESLPALDVIVAWLVATPEAGLRLSGHTDSTGSEEYNYVLSQQRVEKAKAVFEAKGIASERIETFWYGEEALLVDLPGRYRENRGF
jgi:outer membrane protein OmpA-like peptidoglycan-associated protein